MILLIGFLIAVCVIGFGIGLETKEGTDMNKHQTVLTDLPVVIAARAIAEPSRVVSKSDCRGRLIWDDGVVRFELEIDGAEQFCSWESYNRETKEHYSAAQMTHEPIHPAVLPRLERFIRMYR